MANNTAPAVRFREAIPTASLAHLRRLAARVGDIRNADSSSRKTSIVEAAEAGRLVSQGWVHHGRVYVLNRAAGRRRLAHRGGTRGARDQSGQSRGLLARTQLILGARTLLEIHCYMQRLHWGTWGSSSCTSRAIRRLPPHYLARRPHPHQHRFVVDWVNVHGATPLHVAAMKGEVETVQVRRPFHWTRTSADSACYAAPGRVWSRYQCPRPSR